MAHSINIVGKESFIVLEFNTPMEIEMEKYISSEENFFDEENQYALASYLNSNQIPNRNDIAIYKILLREGEDGKITSLSINLPEDQDNKYRISQNIVSSQESGIINLYDVSTGVDLLIISDLSKFHIERIS